MLFLLSTFLFVKSGKFRYQGFFLFSGTSLVLDEQRRGEGRTGGVPLFVRVWVDYRNYKAVNDMQSLTEHWCYKDALCRLKHHLIFTGIYFITLSQWQVCSLYSLFLTV